VKIIAVTACPTGIAHTYMTAEQLEKTGRKRGHEIRVETQGAMGIENELTEDELSQAEAAIIAADIEVEGRERFDRIAKVIDVPVQEALKNPDAVFERIES
jgi:fructose-specific phosphotransferase system IIB component